MKKSESNESHNVTNNAYRKNGKKKIFTTLLIALLSLSNILAQDWPQFLGPDRNNKSDEKGILRSWPANGPEVLWNVNIGPGFGGPAIKAGKVYLLDRDDTVGEALRCFDLNTGKELWKYNYSAPGSVMFPGSRYVPTVDGNYVYSVGHNGDMYCIDINTHKPVWNKNIWTDHGGAKLLNVAEGANARFATQNWAPIALSGGKLIIRDQGTMKCIKVTR